MTVTSGQKCAVLCNDASLLGLLSRMLLVSSIWHSTSYRLTWKVRATKLGRLFFRLVPSAPRTSESGFSLWPTPRANKVEGYSSEGHSPTLMQKVQMWPTPQARDWRSGDRLDTPRMQRKIQQGWTPNLNDLVLWPTPTASPWRSGSGAKPRPGHTPPLTDVLQGRLNPEWVEALQGFPIGWTNIDGPLLPENHSTPGSLRD